MDFNIHAATLNEKPLIHELIQPYLTELSNFPDENPDYKGANGIYIYPYLDAYWQEKERFPYLLYADKKVTGFALVRKAEDHWEMAEFYVKSSSRRLGLAQSCASDIFNNHPGLWRISFDKHNQPSRNLWKKLALNLSRVLIIEGLTDNNHEFISFSV